MTKLFIATPAFDGRVHVQYACALAETKMLLESRGIEVQFQINSSGSLLVAERNRLNKAFLQSDCTHMLCIDSDLGWPPPAVFAMIQHDRDFVGGLYPARAQDKVFLFRAVEKENGEFFADERGLLKMNYIPAGFMLLKRVVIERMTSRFAHKYFEPKAENLKHESGYCLFETEVFEGEFWGEDYVFCRRAREAGFDIWIDPFIEFDHAGARGALINCLVKKDEANPGAPNATN